MLTARFDDADDDDLDSLSKHQKNLIYVFVTCQVLSYIN